MRRTRCFGGRRISRRARWLSVLLVLLWASGARAQRVRVFAAASLTEAFGRVAALAEHRHPGWRVELQFAGSQQLAMQIGHGALAEVFASADDRWMTELRERGLVRGEPRVFARNRLVAIVPESNPGHLERLEDLARSGLKVVLGAPAVPVGRYGREVLEKLSRSPGFGPDFRSRVLRNVVSEEENVKGVVAKVALGEADAGIVYGSDVTGELGGAVRVLPIPSGVDVTASYPIAVLKSASDPGAARAFVDLVLSPAGQEILREQGFVPLDRP